MNTVAESKRIMSDLISSKDIEFIEHIFDLELLCQFEFNQSENLVTLTFLHNSITTSIDDKLLKFPKPDNIRIEIEWGYSEVPRVVDGSIYEKKVRNHQDTVILYIKDSKTMTNLKYVNSIADLDIDIMEIVKGKRKGDAIEIDYKSLSKQPDKDYSKKPKLSGVRVEKFVDKMPSWFDKFKSPDVPNIKIEASFRTREEQEALMYNRPNPHHGSGDMVDAISHAMMDIYGKTGLIPATPAKFKSKNNKIFVYIICENMRYFNETRRQIHIYLNERFHSGIINNDCIIYQPMVSFRDVEILRGTRSDNSICYILDNPNFISRATGIGCNEYFFTYHRDMKIARDIEEICSIIADLSKNK